MRQSPVNSIGVKRLMFGVPSSSIADRRSCVATRVSETQRSGGLVTNMASMLALPATATGCLFPTMDIAAGNEGFERCLSQPMGEAWLPILHADRGKWHFTALFSNTARAHELDKVRD